MNRPPKKSRKPYALPAAIAGIAALAVIGTQQFQGDDASSDPPSASDVAEVTATVHKVSDGDTIRVRLKGESEPERVRILGLDAPEVHTSRDCGGEESWDHLETLLAPGDTVTLISDPSQDFYDQYGRILAYVEDADGADVGAAQIEAGWARVYRKGSRIELFDEYLAAEAKAKSQHRGIWGAC